MAFRSGEEVHLQGSTSIWVITRISDHDADLCLKGTDPERFRVPLHELSTIAPNDDSATPSRNGRVVKGK